MTMAVRKELEYGQLIPEAGQGKIIKIGTYKAKMEINETDSQGKIIGKKAVQEVTLISTDDGVFAIPGDMEGQIIPWYELKNIVTEDIYKQMEKALRRGKIRRRKGKTLRR